MLGERHAAAVSSDRRLKENTQYLCRALGSIDEAMWNVSVKVQAVTAAEGMRFTVVFKLDVSGLHHQEFFAFMS